jgi:prepilin-type N-terminal cleavage/methylation domain-containing protein
MSLKVPAGSRSEGGFSLIEVLIAVVILVVGLVYLAQLMVLATNSNALSGYKTSTAAIAKERLELLKSVPFYSDPQGLVRNIVLLDGGSTTANQPGYFQFYDADGRPSADAARASFLVRWRVETVAVGGGAGNLPLATVQITVRCLPASENNFMFQTIGDSTFVTFRTANIG